MKIEVEEGKALNFHVGFRALKNFMTIEGVGFEQLDSKMSNLNLEQLSTLFHHGFKSGWEIEHGVKKGKKKYPYSQDEMEIWIDKDMSLLKKLTKAMTEQIEALNLGGDEIDSQGSGGDLAVVGD